MSDSLWPHERTLATWLLCPWDFPGKNTGVGSHSLLHGISPTQGSNPDLLYWRQFFFFLPSETPGKPKDLRVSGAILWKATHFVYLYNLWVLCILVISSALSFTPWLKVLFISKIKASPFPVGVNKAVHSSILGPCTQSAKGKEKRKDMGLGAHLQSAEHAWLQALDSSVTSVPVPEITATEPRATATDTPCFL